ncbi:FkbM family methyltransferase [Pelagibacterales bacterium SAG-MED49]|nr:FkbM family methyltransferase [Pelagibacterales bacterium SAG-MED49]
MNNFGLVVLGAHTGEYLKDLIKNYINSKILLVEPVPYNFELLEKEYKAFENIIICKKAILNCRKKDNFYYVKKDSIPKLGKHWASQIGSFDKNHILNHRNKRFKIQEEHIQQIDIEFITFEDLMMKYSINLIDKLQIDVEGAEYEIMKSIDYKKIRINNIIFEAKHFDGTFVEGKKLQEVKEILISNRYTLKKVDKENILAIKN